MKSQMTRNLPMTNYTYDKPVKIGMIPDTHWDPSHRKDSLKVARALGRVFRAEEVDIVVHIGDANDIGSLSSYDVGKASMEGKRLKRELAFSRQCLEEFRFCLGSDDVDLYLTEGNHEDRLYRMYNDQPSLSDVLGPDPFSYEEYGFEVLSFRSILELNKVYFSHYFQNPNSAMGHPIGGTIENALKNLGHSFVQGHVQTLKMGQMHRSNGDIHCGLIAGACYIPDHAYKGPQGNNHWKGAIIMENVNDGYYDIRTLGLKSLLRNY